MYFKELTLTPGYIGLSIGEANTNPQAIVWAGEDNFHFYPVSKDTAWNLDDWYHKGGEIEELRGILPHATEEEINMFYFGTTEYLGEF